MIRLLLTTLLLAATVAHSNDEHYTHTFVIGGIQPTDLKEGQLTPVFVYKYDPTDGNLKFNYVTSTADLSYTRDINSHFQLELGAKGTIISEGSPATIYVDGKRITDHSFNANSGALRVAGHIKTGTPLEIILGMERKDIAAYPNADTAIGFETPSHFGQYTLNITLNQKGLPLLPKAKASIALDLGKRTGFDDWGLDPNAEQRETFVRGNAQIKIPIQWNDNNESDVKVTLAAGKNVDLFSGIHAGGSGSDVPVIGFFRNEFRSDRVAAINISHDWKASPNDTVTIYLDAANLRQQSFDYLGIDSGKNRNVVGAGIGLRHDIQSLYGIPVILRFGQALVDSGSTHDVTNQREVMLFIALAFK